MSILLVLIWSFFSENYMKMKKIGAQKRGVDMRSWQPPWINQYILAIPTKVFFSKKKLHGAGRYYYVWHVQNINIFTNLVLILHCFSCGILKRRSRLKLVPHIHINDTNHFSNCKDNYTNVLCFHKKFIHWFFCCDSSWHKNGDL